MSLLVYITIVIESVSESLRSNECQRQRAKITTNTRKGQTFHQSFPFIFFAPRSFTQVISKPLLYVCLVEATLFLSLQLSVIFPLCQVAIVNNCKACMDFTDQLKVGFKMLERFSIECHEPKLKWSQRPLRRKGYALTCRWELEIKTSKLPKARENAGYQVVIGF